MKNNNYVSRKPFNKPLEGGEFPGASTYVNRHEPVQSQHLEVEVFGNFDKALRAFRALVQKERILSLYKEKQSYEKPSDKKRRKRNEMKRKLLEVQNNHDFKKNRRDASPE